MTRKDLVLLLHNKREVPFVAQILTGATVDLQVKEGKGKFYVLPKKAKLGIGNELSFPTQGEANWFTENYGSFKSTGVSVEPKTI